jgi:signal transduction histidine kinase
LAHANESEVRLEVADTGFGVPAAEQPHLFERFFRASPAMDNAVAGTGLGLTIAKAIVDAHEGEITIQSELGRGTSVRVRLPVGRDAGSGDS